eukprot:CAMPEP_0119269714 /NCGR_PEP_ID=MMETSP1329-20130426/7006_1 /TAXON_ID=114041 /ORGANISM="Genus nov. species nov., Strain RCC1024" /LENGTH=415 /DNA_ID=CAMNT_0007269715 /DNA_START=174 /DNA_END=1418 /DNA_ORIENTATION=-
MRAALAATLAVALLAPTTALAPKRVALGLVKYAHNACCAVVDADSGNLLFAGEKERLTRVKNDGGAVGDLVRHALSAVGCAPEAVVSVVANDHHRSVALTEAALLRAKALGLASSPLGLDSADVADPCNHWPGAREMSHHLSHALGAAAAFGPTRKGLVVCMDGMGDEARRFRGPGRAAVRDDFGGCQHVVNSEAVEGFAAVPDDARECETAYLEGADGRLTPLFKRWCRGNSALMGYADWFAPPLDSLGAAYSDASHRIFGDWNACGKVMGLAPWGGPGAAYDAGWGAATRESWGPLATKAAEAVFASDARPRIYAGALWPAEGEAPLEVDRGAIDGVLALAAEALGRGDLVFPARNLWASGDDAMRACGAVLAHAVQRDLEDAALGFLARARGEVPGCERVVLCGGVGLNSVL